jgi:putative aminopeptidase FrvX
MAPMRVRIMLVFGALLLLARGAAGQSKVDLARFGEKLGDIPAVTGHEAQLSKSLFEALAAFEPKTDNLGNVYVTVGSGAPHRLIATAIDEPGYVVSEITSAGYLRVQRLPQAPPSAVFDALNFAQPVLVITRTGKQVPGVFAGLSVHLQPGRLNPPKMNHVEELYVDIGAKSVEEVSAAGVETLDAIALLRSAGPPPSFLHPLFMVGHGGQAGTGTADRMGAEMLLQLTARLRESKAKGTTTIAFVTQQWLGARGLNRLLTEMHPDEMTFVGRVQPAQGPGGDTKTETLMPGSGVLLGFRPEEKDGGLKEELQRLAENEQIPLQGITAVAPRFPAYSKSASLPDKFVEIGVPALWPVTPAEYVSGSDTGRLERLLEAYLEIPKPTGGGAIAGDRGLGSSLLQDLVEAYGASGHEGAVRDKVKQLLPEWAQSKTRTDAAGNLVLHVGTGTKDDQTPRIAFVAHLDEIGFAVKKIEDDGRLQVDALGGGYPQYFFGHVALVHKKDGTTVGGVMELPNGWEKPGFAFPNSPRSIDEPGHVFVGTKTKEESEKLGIAVGDYVTIPKQYRPLLGTRANGRSFDDRVGCAALVAAVRALGPDLPGRDVTFVWSTEEEVGLKGAAAFAEQAAKEGRVPDFVFAIDTFVSSDSPLESKRFGDAELGKGFVVRAVDNSNIVPLQYVDRVVGLAKDAFIPVQYGVTGGGNDGAVFTRFGSVDVALGWPLRYSHSPGEVIDTKDLDALGKIVEVIARKW